MPFRVAYGKYLCRTWNGPGYEENLKDPGQLMSLKFIWHSEPVIWNESLDSKGGGSGKMEGMKSITLYSHLCFLEKKEQKHEGVAKEAKAEEEGQTQKQSGMTIAARANKLGATEGG